MYGEASTTMRSSSRSPLFLPSPRSPRLASSPRFWQERKNINFRAIKIINAHILFVPQTFKCKRANIASSSICWLEKFASCVSKAKRATWTAYKIIALAQAHTARPQKLNEWLLLRCTATLFTSALSTHKTRNAWRAMWRSLFFGGARQRKKRQKNLPTKPKGEILMSLPYAKVKTFPIKALAKSWREIITKLSNEPEEL